MANVVYVVTSLGGGYAREDLPTVHVDGVYTSIERAEAHRRVCHGEVHTLPVDVTPPGILEFMKALGIKNV